MEDCDNAASKIERKSADEECSSISEKSYDVFHEHTILMRKIRIKNPL